MRTGTPFELPFTSGPGTTTSDRTICALCGSCTGNLHALPLPQPDVEADEDEHEHEHDDNVLRAALVTSSGPRTPALLLEDVRASRAIPCTSSGSACPGFLDPSEQLPFGQPSLSEPLQYAHVPRAACSPNPAARLKPHVPCHVQTGSLEPLPPAPTSRHEHARTAVLELRMYFQ